MYYTIGTVSLTPILGSYTLSFFSNAAANNKYETAAVGSILNILVLIIAALGMKLSARFQWIWAVFEYACLAGFSIAAVSLIYFNGISNTVRISGSWFTISGAGGFHALVAGVLIAIFLYSGWDTAAYVGEEVKDNKAGSAALTSVVLLFVVYSIGIVALQGVAPHAATQSHAGNVLAFAGQRIAGGFGKNLSLS